MESVEFVNGRDFFAVSAKLLAKHNSLTETILTNSSFSKYSKYYLLTLIDNTNEIDIFKKVIDECIGRPLQFIRITADGEPLVHTKLFAMIDYAVDKGLGPVGLTTNGSLSTKDKAERLVESGLFMVDFSLDAFKKETYNKVRYGLPFDKVIDNIKYLLDYKKKINATLKVMVSFVKQKDNISELGSFKNYWGAMVDKVLIREMISNVNLIDMPVTERNKGLKNYLKILDLFLYLDI